MNIANSILNPALSIPMAVLVVALTTWVAWRYKTVGAFGLAAVLLLPITIGGWYRDLPQAALWATALVTLALFIVGMLISKKWDDLFHLAALASTLFLPLIIGAFFVGIQLPTIHPPKLPLGVLVLVIIAVVVVVRRWRKRRKPPVQQAEQPATT